MIGSIANSLGFGSGIDTAALVSSLAAASRDPKAERFDQLARSNQVKVSALAQARSDLDNIADSLSSLVTGGTLRSQPVSSDTNAVAVTSSAGTLLGNYTGEIVVQSLASAQTIYSGYVASASDAIGQGNMTLSVGGTDFGITIDASNDSLTGLVTAINASGSGVRASLVNDAGQSRLVLKGQSGAINAFTLTADAGAPAGLAAFSTSAMTVGQQARDALFTVDGVAYARTKNAIDDVVPGLTISLKKADPAAVISVSATRPTETLKQTMADFVTVFNALRSDVAAARSANNGNPALRAFERQLSSLIGQRLVSGSDIASLADVGLSTNRDGTVSLDSAKFDAALRRDPDAVEAFFNPPRDGARNETTDPGLAVILDSMRDAAVSGNGALELVRTSLQRESENIAKNRERMELRESSYRTRLEQQYSTLDARIGALKATQSYLEQQIKLWNGDGR